MDKSLFIFLAITIFFIYILHPFLVFRPAIKPVIITENFTSDTKSDTKEMEEMIQKMSKLYDDKHNNLNPSDLIIPMPKFENSLPNKENFQSNTKKPQKVLPTKTKNKPVLTPKLTNSNCKMIATMDIMEKCPSEYSVYSGVNISLPGVSLCGEVANLVRAEAIANIKDGKLQEIRIINSGNNYIEPPNVIIEGDARIKATAVAILKDEKVDKIKITNSGKSYASTPKIIIDKPNKPIICKMCCKNAL